MLLTLASLGPPFPTPSLRLGAGSEHLAAIEEADYAVGLAGLLLIVGHHHYGASLLAVEPMQYLHHLAPHVRVEIAGGLVGQYDLRCAGYGAGYGHALALSAGELRGEMVQPVAETELLEHFAHPLLARPGALSVAVSEREGHILHHVERWDKMETLKDEAQIEIAEAR